jgi:hypothetical protein
MFQKNLGPENKNFAFKILFYVYFAAHLAVPLPAAASFVRLSYNTGQK